MASGGVVRGAVKVSRVSSGRQLGQASGEGGSHSERVGLDVEEAVMGEWWGLG